MGQTSCKDDLMAYSLCILAVHSALYASSTLIKKEIQMGLGAKSYMRKGLLILYVYEEMSKNFTIYKEAVSHI